VKPSKAQQPAARTSTLIAAPAGLDEPFGMKPAAPAAPNSDESPDDEEFRHGLALADTVKSDPTVDRQRLRAQCARLGELGYALTSNSGLEQENAMNQLYALPEFSNLPLQASSSLREVVQDLADLFVIALYDRIEGRPGHRPAAYPRSAGRAASSPDGDTFPSVSGAQAQEYTLWLTQRLDRCIRFNRVSL
jgi:hypothetical protein